MYTFKHDDLLFLNAIRSMPVILYLKQKPKDTVTEQCYSITTLTALDLSTQRQFNYNS